MATERFNGESGNATLRCLAGSFVGLLLLTQGCSTVDVRDPDWPEADCPVNQDEVLVPIEPGGTYIGALESVFGVDLPPSKVFEEGKESGIGSTPDEVLNNAGELPPGKITICE